LTLHKVWEIVPSAGSSINYIISHHLPDSKLSCYDVTNNEAVNSLEKMPHWKKSILLSLIFTSVKFHINIIYNLVVLSKWTIFQKHPFIAVTSGTQGPICHTPRVSNLLPQLQIM